MADVYVYAPAREQGEADIFVGVNGKGYRVPRGKPCTLPEAAAQELVKGNPEAMILDGIIDAGGGGGDGGVIKAEIQVDGESAVISNLTWQQMHDAVDAGKIVTMLYEYGPTKYQLTLSEITHETGEVESYVVKFTNVSEMYFNFEAESADGYPVISM